ncbi:MAG TPA: alpha/beta fold hydrolase [Vicinamibacterales bacterium]|nr:alpha/beta fold hydrolase [Vicinamibacterales bacterium]
MRVLLVHGLGRSPLSMAFLARRLSKSGHRPAFFAYSPLLESHDRIVSRLIARLRRLGAHGTEVGLIGHSFGGLVLREALAHVPELRVRHLVMFGTPNQTPRLAVRARRWLPYRWLRRSCGDCLGSPEWFDQLPAVSSPYTIVAGTAGWRGRRSLFQGEPNDGLVAVSETMVTDRDEPALFPVIHTLMMNDRAVYRLIADRLENAAR